jgi:RecB family exonuclease
MVDDARGRRLARRVADSAKTVVFSYASELEAGRQRPSSALKDLSLNKAPIDTSAWMPSAIPAISLMGFADTAVVQPPERIMQGGAEILRLQAACGFRAFAEKRLFADELKSIELGMDASERGNVVHRTLEYFWNEVKTQETLRSMSHALRNETLQRAIDHGLRKALQATETAWDEAYVEVQRRRLLSLIDAWLSIELKRDPFDVRLSEKEFRDVAIGPLRLGVRVDRIDATADGNVIIDYKTGRARSSDWLGTRPDAPQLPLYAVLACELEPETKLADVAFAVVRAGNQAVLDTCTRKITREFSKPLRRPIPVEEQLTTWRGVLQDLAIRFYSGDASVDPKSYPQTCTYCAHRTLCRLNPEELNFEEDLDEQTEDDSTK